MVSAVQMVAAREAITDERYGHEESVDAGGSGGASQMQAVPSFGAVKEEIPHEDLASQALRLQERQMLLLENQQQR